MQAALQARNVTSEARKFVIEGKSSIGSNLSAFTDLKVELRGSSSITAGPGSESPSNGATTRRPRIGNAVVSLLENAPQQTLTAKEIVAAMEERGWLPTESKDPRNTVGAALSRMARDDGEIERLHYGTYRLKPKESPITA